MKLLPSLRMLINSSHFLIEGSEIVGLIPLGVLEGITQHYIKCPQFSSSQVIEKRILGFE
jgi:glutamate formiminotransferase